MQIIPIPCLKDNYAYLLIDPPSGQAAVVDPSEAAPVLKAFEAATKKQPLELVAILNTHHHWDHVGGNQELLELYPQLRVYGHVSDRGRIQGQTEYVDRGDRLAIGNLIGHVVHNPGHTLGAVSYAFEDALFTGDTLFGGGCGRTFEGDAAMMYHSLNRVIGSFPDQTRVFFGHEYTVANLRFALMVEPSNSDVRMRSQKVVGQRGSGQLTTPSTLGEERLTNPFFRCDEPELIESIRRHEPGLDNSNPAEVFRVLRAWKDRF
ncbi:MAG: hydroxyacylglutathione hydrolase [Candidatus Melainabacteria bacterium HGW-Melainabacteria-1]|nr:MAG: hydroxyacylglutathione hydrolase [Candidatus Melainabacteria bacterium HGW-Melainabacteria-1]